MLRQLREKESGNVYATDAILAVLMSCVVSAYSWDLVLTIKEKPKTEAPPQEETSEEDEDEEDEDEEEEEEDYNKELIFDKIDGSSIDFLDVNENSNDPPPDEDENPFNTVEALSKEVTFLNYNYAQQICHKVCDSSFLHHFLIDLDRCSYPQIPIAFSLPNFRREGRLQCLLLPSF